MKFKVGDKVEAVSAYYGGLDVVMGEVGTIYEVRPPDAYIVGFPSHDYWDAKEKDLILAKEPVMIKIDDKIREKSAVKAIETMKASNFGLTALKVEFEAHFKRNSAWNDLVCHDYMMERLAKLGLAERKDTFYNKAGYSSHWHPKGALTFAKFYVDGSVDSEFTFTLLMDDPNNVLLLPEIMDIFTSIGKETECMNTKKAGLHIALVKTEDGSYSTRDAPTPLDSKRFKNFQKSMTMLLPALYFLGSQNTKTRGLRHRQPKVGSGQIDGYNPSNPKYSAISYRGTALEFRVFDTCYDTPEQILDNIVVMKNAIRYWRKEYRSPNLHKICDKVKFGLNTGDSLLKLDSMYITAEHIDLLNAGLRLLKPHYYTVRQLKQIKDFRSSKRGIVAKLKTAQEKATKEYREYEERWKWQALVREQYRRAEEIDLWQSRAGGSVIISADRKEVMKSIEKAVADYMKKEARSKLSLKEFVRQKVEAIYGRNTGDWELSVSERGA